MKLNRLYMNKLNMLCKLNVRRNDKLVFTESYRLGSIESREAMNKLIYDVEVQVDMQELATLSKDKDIQDQISKVTGVKYQEDDWRHKGESFRTQALKDKPVGNKIIMDHKDEVMAEIKKHFSDIPVEWANLVMADHEYGIDPKAKQLNEIDGWFSAYGIAVFDLGKFMTKFAEEFKAAGMPMQFKSSLTGFNKMMAKIDEFAGQKLSDTVVDTIAGKWEIADEKGYDKEVRSGFLEQMSDAISNVADKVIFIDSIADDGTVTLKAEEYGDTVEDSDYKNIDD